MRNKIIGRVKYVFLSALLLTTCCGNINKQNDSRQTEIKSLSQPDRAASIEERVLLPLTDTLTLAGFDYFEYGDILIYKKGETTLHFEASASRVKKDLFTYYLGKESEEKNGVLFVNKDLIEKMIGQNIRVNNEEIRFEDYNFEPHMWTNEAGALVAHACGGINGINGGNCLEALVTSYNNGHTVFEIDLNLTSDDQMVAIHGWEGYGGIKSHEEFKDIKIADVFTTMDIDDILQIMLLNKEIYVITDTKSYDDDGDEIKKQFTILRDKALSYDKELLNRIIPQVYNQEMYWLIKEIYPFKSIVYTLYASHDNDMQVVEFVSDKEDIKVITMAPSRFSDDFYKKLTKNAKLIYLFTLNDKDEVRDYMDRGVHGIYTDFIFPRDL